MRRYILSIVALATCVAVFANHRTDSISTFKTASADSIVIQLTSDGVNVDVINNDASGQKIVKILQPIEGNIVVKTRKRRWVPDKMVGTLISNVDTAASHNGSGWAAVCGGINFGFNKAIGAPVAVDIDMSKSYELGLLYILGAEYTFPGQRQSITMGVGVNWRNYRLAPTSRFIPTVGGIAVDAYPENVIPKRSRLKIFSLQLPIIFAQRLPLRIGKYNTRLYLGGILSLNTHASISTMWLNEQGNEVSINCDKVNQRKLTVDGIVGIRVQNWLSVYAKYCPIKVMNDNSPQFSSFSTGIMIGF